MQVNDHVNWKFKTLKLEMQLFSLSLSEIDNYESYEWTFEFFINFKR